MSTCFFPEDYKYEEIASDFISIMYPSEAVVRFDENDVKLKHPFSMVLAGGRRTGKTQLIKSVIVERERIITPPIKHVIWFYASEQEDVFNEIKESMGNEHVEFVKGLPANTNIEEAYLTGRHGTKLVVIDDLMSEANTRQDVNHLFTRGRHLDTSVVFLVQNFHNQGKYMRENTLNSDYVALFRNPRDATIVSYLGRQMGQMKFVNEAFELATKGKPFSYLFIDLRSDTNDKLRFRNDILATYPRFFVETL